MPVEVWTGTSLAGCSSVGWQLDCVQGAWCTAGRVEASLDIAGQSLSGLFSHAAPTALTGWLCPADACLSQVFHSGTDELLELFKATYELHNELGMDAPGQPVRVSRHLAAPVAGGVRILHGAAATQGGAVRGAQAWVASRGLSARMLSAPMHMRTLPIPGDPHSRPPPAMGWPQPLPRLRRRQAHRFASQRLPRSFVRPPAAAP